MSENTPPSSQDLADKVPARAKAAYGFGGVIDIFGHWLYAFLANPVFNVQLGLSATRVGDALMIARLADACTDPLFGWLSDNTRSRWGRRRPFIAVGAVLSALALPCLFLVPPDWSHTQIFWFMVVSLTIYAPFISAFNMPYQSLGAEMSPSYHERTSVQSWKALIQKIAGAGCSAAVAFASCSWFFDASGEPDTRRGAFWAAAIAGLVMLAAGLANVAFVRERYYTKASTQAKSSFWRSFATTLARKPFLALIGIALVYSIPSSLAGTLGYYVTLTHVSGGDVAAAGQASWWAGLGYMIGGFLGVPAAAALSRRLGKTRALHVTIVMGMLAFGSSWWLYTPGHVWLMSVCNAFNGFSATGLWVILPSMCADVVDYDETLTGLRREGAFAAAFSWMLKVGISLSMGLGGRIIDLSGYDAALKTHQPAEAVLALRVWFAALPVGALVLAWALLFFFPLTQERMASIRATLESRRGTV